MALATDLCGDFSGDPGRVEYLLGLTGREVLQVASEWILVIGNMIFGGAVAGFAGNPHFSNRTHHRSTVRLLAWIPTQGMALDTVFVPDRHSPRSPWWPNEGILRGHPAFVDDIVDPGKLNQLESQGAGNPVTLEAM